MFPINKVWILILRCRESLKVGDLLTMHGKVAAYKGSPQIVHPEYDKLNANEISLTTGFIIPVYPLTDDLKKSGLDNRNLRKIIYLALESVDSIDDHFDKELRKKFNIEDLDISLRNIHYPKDFESLEKSTHRLKYDEHFFLQLLLAMRKSKIKENKYDSIKFKTKSYNKILKNLDFELTGSQQLSLREIVDDFISENPMNRMIQGDVGCGKTIVSILASSIVVDNDYQVGIMAPTDLLSKQLYKNFKSHFKAIGINCSLLVGSLKPKDKDKVLEDIKFGKSNIIIGTHALFQKDVQFHNLGFVVIDEQHRFGVNQRQKLLSKSTNPNLMAMTATPIPRTLAITYNGDMDLSIIDELPKNRPDIHTSFIEKDNLSTAFNFIREKVESGGQTIIVYPLINESEKQDLSAAVESYEYLSNSIFPDLNVGLMHGQLEDENKNNEMQKFMEGDIDILISTTVVEVGIDNPNVNVMLINNSEESGNINTKAEVLISVQWPDEHPDDVDAVVEDPQGGLVWYHNRDTGLMHLDRDDRGNLADSVKTEGEVVSNPINQETVTLRGLQTGEYVINLLHYKSNYKEPLPVTVKVEKLNPTVELIYYGQHFLNGVGDEITALRFSVDGAKEISNLNQLPKRLLTKALGRK